MPGLVLSFSAIDLQVVEQARGRQHHEGRLPGSDGWAASGAGPPTVWGEEEGERKVF